MRKRIIAATAAAVASMSTLIAVAPAQAAPYDGRCDSGELCIYEHPGFQGGMADFDGDINDYAGFTFVGVPWVSVNDNASSFVSKAQWQTAYLFEHANQRGRMVTQVLPGRTKDSIADDNMASSHDFSF